MTSHEPTRSSLRQKQDRDSPRRKASQECFLLSPFIPLFSAARIRIVEPKRSVQIFGRLSEQGYSERKRAINGFAIPFSTRDPTATIRPSESRAMALKYSGLSPKDLILVPSLPNSVSNVPSAR